jgi:hypothetical protein
METDEFLKHYKQLQNIQKEHHIKGSQTIDILIKILTPIITIAGLLIGIWQFNVEQADKDKLEFKRRVWEKQLDAYTNIATITSKIVTENNKIAKDSLSREFEQLYWGKLPLFDDNSIQLSLKQFHDLLNDEENNIKDMNDEYILKEAAYRLIKNCQASLRATWNELSK